MKKREKKYRKLCATATFLGPHFIRRSSLAKKNIVENSQPAQNKKF